MIKGSIVALITPFHEDGSVNFEKLGELLEWHIANSTDGILVLGTTGESTTMTHEEDDAVVEFTLKTVNHRVPVIAGSGSNDTKTMLEKSRKYADLGVDALLVITPYYNKANEEGMIRHFTTVADNVSAPLILYNVPGRTGCSLSVSAVERLSKHPNIIGIKEASGNISYAVSVSRFVNENFAMYSGNDDMVANWMEGKQKEALGIQQKYLDYIHALFCEVNPIPVKEALNAMGCAVGGYRLPLYEMAEANKQKLYAEMKKVGLL